MMNWLFVVLCTLLLSLTYAQGPTITGISGCQYESPVRTINCPRPIDLTLTGIGFMIGLEDERYPTSRMSIQINNAHRCYPSPNDMPTNTTILCTMADPGYGKLPSGVLMSISFKNLLTSNTSTLENAISFAEELPPRVDRVTGCRIASSDGRSVSQCDIANDRITLHGSGFMSVDHTLAKLVLGSSVHSIFLFYTTGMIVRYDENTIVLNFGASESYIPAIEAQSGGSLALHLEDNNSPDIWSTEPVYVSFLPLPDPVVTSITIVGFGQGCVIDNSTNPMRYRDCISGMSALRVNGDFLFAPIVVTIGGQTCRVTGAGSGYSYVQVYMPIFPSLEGVFYDMTITTVAGTVTLPGLVEFNHDQLVYQVVPCADYGPQGDWPSSHCMPGETLTIKILNVRQSVAPRVWIMSLFNNSVLTECPNPQLVDENTVTCTTPSYGAADPWASVALYLQWPDRSKTKDLTVTPLWDPVGSPRVTSISGCYSDSGNPLHLNQCLGESNGIVLTINGVRLAEPTGPWFVVIGRRTACIGPMVVNNETIICLLPHLSDAKDLVYDVQYPVSVQAWAEPHWLQSNAAYITYVREEVHASRSSTSASTIALATVFSIVGAVLIAVCLFVMCRSVRGKQRNAKSELSPEFSSTGKHIELEEV